MKNIEKWLIPIMIIIVIVIILLVLLIMYRVNNNQGYNNYKEEIISGDLYNYDNPEVEAVNNPVNFFTVSKCISQYLDARNQNNSAYFGRGENGESEKILSDEEIAKGIIDFLDKDYVLKNNITVENLYDYVGETTEREIFVPLKINMLPGRVTEKYAVYGYIQDSNNNFIRNIYAIVTLDVENNTFSIEPLQEENYNNIDEIKLVNNDINIEKNDNNIFEYSRINQEYIATQYFDNFKRMLLGNPSLAYEYLDEDYKKARFENFETFEKWIEENRELISKLLLTKYQTSIKDNYTQYVLIDKNDKEYIFRETGTMQFKIILDTYTIDIPEFVERYNESNTQEKVILNINKFMQSINDKNYKYAYSLLANSFKSQNFRTEQEFENYVKENFFETNNFSYEIYGNESGTYYTYEVKITDETGENTEDITKTFIVLLKDGTDFELSFNV